MKTQLFRLGKLSVLSIIFTAGLVVGLVVANGGVAATIMAQSGAAPDYHLIDEAWNAINQHYVDRSVLKAPDVTYGAISGMTDALGDTGHSRFLTPSMLKDENTLLSGKFQGIGAEVQMKGGKVTIVAPFDGSPAQKAGLRSGDVIEKVNGKTIAGLSLQQVVQQLLGTAGTPVTVTILTPASGNSRDVTIVRAEVTIQSVTWQLLPGTTIAHLRIANFSQTVTADLRQALTEIQQQHLSGVILDLRDDPGGLLTQAVDVASQFLESGNALLEKDAQGNERPIPVTAGGLGTQIPVAVLINGGTASAAEIVAGALQDAHRATIIGVKTFGTGTVLQEFSLSDGSALLLATQEWLTPAGRVIWHQGISPDINVTLSANTFPLVPEAERSMTADQLQASGDQQLLRAVQQFIAPKEPKLPTATKGGNPSPGASAQQDVKASPASVAIR